MQNKMRKYGGNYQREAHNTSGCAAELQKQGITLWNDADGGYVPLRIACVLRYTTPDEKVNIIMDYCYYAE